MINLKEIDDPKIKSWALFATTVLERGFQKANNEEELRRVYKSFMDRAIRDDEKYAVNYFYNYRKMELGLPYSKDYIGSMELTHTQEQIKESIMGNQKIRLKDYTYSLNEMDLDRTWDDVFGKERGAKLMKKQQDLINDPVLMKARAAKTRHEKEKEEEKMRDRRWGKTDRERQQYRWALQDELDDLKAQQKQMYIDMEQEAEPEGGEIADRYGSDLNDIEAKIDIITAELDEMDLFESINEVKYRVEYTTQDGEKAKSRVYNSEEEADKKEEQLVNSGIRQAKVVKVEEAINEYEDQLFLKSKMKQAFLEGWKSAHLPTKQTDVQAFERFWDKQSVDEGSCGYTHNVKSGKKHTIPGGKKGLAEKIKSIIKNIQ